MKKTFKLTLLLMVFVFAGCKHDHLYYGSMDKTTISVQLNWEDAELDLATDDYKESDGYTTLNGITAYAYYSDTKELYSSQILTNPNVVNMELPLGDFDIVVYNNTYIDYNATTSLKFAGEDNLSTLRATGYPREESKLFNARSAESDANIIYPMRPLARAVLRNVEVTAEDFKISYDKPTDEEVENQGHVYTVSAEPVTERVVLTARVKGLIYARAAPTVQFSRLSFSRYLFENIKCSEETVVHQFILNNRNLDAETNNYDGDLLHRFSILGLFDDDPQAIYNLDLNTLLIDDNMHSTNVQLTREDIEWRQDPTDGVWKHFIHIDFTLPKVSPSGSGEDGGFGTDLEEWKELEFEIIF